MDTSYDGGPTDPLIVGGVGPIYTSGPGTAAPTPPNPPIPREEPLPGDKNFVAGLPAKEARRIRALARRYAREGHHDEFMLDAKQRMYEHALKLESMMRYAEDPTHVSQLAGAYRKAVVDIVSMHTQAKARK